ncbi:Microsomal glutathione S-transferase 3 [Bulinus truncatus]|nr:Microsomal glutathione S-transferase 3 [Bulinus truncatus]
MAGGYQLPGDYGYVALVVAESWILLNYLGFQVMKARKKYDVQYPKLYSDVSMEFNCIQRAHQNTLEVYPQFLAFLLLGGLQFPRASAVLGNIWLVSRVVYAHGYYTFDPSKRNRGAFGYIGLLGLLVNTVLFGLNSTGFI